MASSSGRQRVSLGTIQDVSDKNIAFDVENFKEAIFGKTISPYYSLSSVSHSCSHMFVNQDGRGELQCSKT